MRILRARPAGTAYGGTGQIHSVPGVMHTKDTAVGDKDAAAMLMAAARMREGAARRISRTPVTTSIPKVQKGG